MKLPNRENAYIPPRKLTEYLLSETHSIGKSKAKFFRAIGFHDENANLLEQGLIAIAQVADVQDVVTSPHGTKYIVEGELQTPAGNVVQVRTIWIIEQVQGPPRFVTAYPL